MKLRKTSRTRRKLNIECVIAGVTPIVQFFTKIRMVCGSLGSVVGVNTLMCSDKEEKRGGKKKKTAALMGYNFAGGTRNNSEQLK